MDEKCVRTIDLENGLILEIHDGSRCVAADRWLILLTAVIRIELTEALLNAAATGAITAAQFRGLLGGTIRFEKEMKRNFIAAGLKERVFEEMAASFLDSALPYLSAPDFAVKYLKKAYGEALKKQRYSAPPTG